MKKIVALILVSICFLAYSQKEKVALDTISFKVYKSSLALKKGWADTIIYKGTVKSKDGFFIKFKHLYKKGEKMRDNLYDIYAIEYNNEKYIHLAYMYQVNKGKNFAKIIHQDEKFAVVQMNEVKGNSYIPIPTSTGVAIHGLLYGLVDSINKNRAKVYDENGEELFLALMSFDDFENGGANLNSSSLLHLVSKRALMQVLPKHKKEIKKMFKEEKLQFDKIMNWIKNYESEE